MFPFTNLPTKSSQPSKIEPPSHPLVWSPLNAVKSATEVSSNPNAAVEWNLPVQYTTAQVIRPQPVQPSILSAQTSIDLPTDESVVTDCYASLLGLAERFRTMSPPNIRLAVHCLKAVILFKLPANLEARTHLQLGRLLFHHSKSDDQTKFHLERARTLGAHLRAKDDSIKYEAAALLADFFERKGKRYEAICIRNDAIRLSNNNPYWHCRLLLELAQAHIAERDVNSACDILAMGAEFAQLHNSDYTHGLFLLSKCMLLLSSRQLLDVTNTLTAVSQLMENFRGTDYHREALRVFYLILHVSFYLVSGEAKLAKPILRQLHQSIQQFAAMDEVSDCASTNEMDRFHWMPREHMVILVYLITVTQSMQSGLLERAKRSAEKALTQIEKLSVFDTSPLLTVFHLSLLEHTAMGRLVMGIQAGAAQDISQACRVCQSNPALLYRRLPQLHTLIGLYAMSMNHMTHAESQFKLALRMIAGPPSATAVFRGGGLVDLHNSTSAGGGALALTAAGGTGRACCQPDGPRDPLSVLICLNLALVHIRQGNTSECETLLNEVFTAGTHVLEGCFCLKTAASYVRAFQAFYENRIPEAKEYLRETVCLGNEKELLRLSASAFITMGQINLNEGNATEGQKMVSAAIRVANRLPDIGIQLWATALLKDVANLCRDSQEETRWFSEHDRYSKLVIDEHMRAITAPEHRLIEWLDGPLSDWLLPNVGLSSSSNPNASLL